MKFQKHEASGFAYIVVSTDEQYTRKPFVYREANVVEKFLEKMDEEEKKIHRILSKPVAIKFTQDDEKKSIRQHTTTSGATFEGDRCRITTI